MIGAIPPAAINDWRYLAVALVAGIVTFCWSLAVLAGAAVVVLSSLLNVPSPWQ